ncbi:ABC transporter permease [Arenicella sp. 4NH20-0111]|uniref:ABC transporter permease n=1 Tax=Arenicella sp. 4NH20-0111 TaxID=3127648 RepID=UPI003106778C
MLLRLAIKSLLDRKSSVLLTCFALTISIFVLLGVEHIRKESKESFSSTISGADLIVGAKSGRLNLLLYSVFRMGSPINNISWRSYQNIAAAPDVDWTIPISLGDSHNGFRVLGTNNDYFEYFKYGRKQSLSFELGNQFRSNFDVVLGAEVAASLKYKLGDKVVLSHGIGDTSFTIHDENPFTITGILTSTGTPVDQTVHVGLEGIEAIHQGIGSTHAKLKPSSITAFIIGLKSRISTFKLQRHINEMQEEPLMAILPGVALSELWRMMSMLENTLLLISSMVFVAAVLGLTAVLASSIRERRKEISLLRTIGAPPSFLFLLFQLEALLVSLVSMFTGSALLCVSLSISQSQISKQFGLHLSTTPFSMNSLSILLSMMFITALAASLPAFQAYKEAKTAY